MPDDQTPKADASFEPSTGALDAAGPPPLTPETAVQPLSNEVVATFNARADETALRQDLRSQLFKILGTLGEAAARKFLGL